MRKSRISVWLKTSLCLFMLLAGAIPAFADKDRPPAGEALQPEAPQDTSKLQVYWQEALSANEGVSAEGSSAVSLFGPFRSELLAKAQPDECFNGAGNPYPPGPPCTEGRPKVNQAYVWGLAKSGPVLWFGTAANVLCLVIGGFLNMTIPMQTESFACEFGQSRYAQPPWSLPPVIGDWRSPRIYTYDTVQKTLTDRTPADQRLMTTLGLRSAMATGKVAILAGPGLSGGVNLFAFNTETGEYLGSANLPEYNNIRKWLQVGNDLYTGVRNTTGGGSVLRWRGNADTLQNLFDFEVVGTLETEAAELALHDRRIFVTTWPELNVQPPRQASLNMSPVVTPAGLTAADAGSWTKLWQASDYEPDPVTAATYGGGALASFDDYLYWGTMHVPFTAALAHVRVYGPPADQQAVLATILGSNRAISIFRGRGLGTPNQKIELAYGMRYLPSYSPQTGWQIVPNNVNAAPLFGPSGFGNFYNNYTWSMAVYRKQLFVGTMDWSYLLGDTLPIIVQFVTGQPLTANIPFPLGGYGADLWRFPDARLPALPVNLFGVGNPTNYGVRNMLPADALYLGMANPMNLLTGDQGPKGGWELLKVQPGRREPLKLEPEP